MAKYKSQYQELGFYVNGEFRQFNGGYYVTEELDVVKVLDGITDVVRVDEPKPKAEEAPKVKAPKKASGK